MGAEQLIQTEVLVPVQFYSRGSRSLPPSFTLMLAVLEQAVHDLTEYRHAGQSWTQRLYVEAYRWVESGDRSHPFTFVNLCETLGYSPSALRQSLLHPGSKPGDPPHPRRSTGRRAAPPESGTPERTDAVDDLALTDRPD